MIGNLTIYLSSRKNWLRNIIIIISKFSHREGTLVSGGRSPQYLYSVIACGWDWPFIITKSFFYSTCLQLEHFWSVGLFGSFPRSSFKGEKSSKYTKLARNIVNKVHSTLFMKCPRDCLQNRSVLVCFKFRYYDCIGHRLSWNEIFSPISDIVLYSSNGNDLILPEKDW